MFDAGAKRLDIFNKFWSYLKGTIWWCREKVIRDRFSNTWNNSDSDAHPMLSLREQMLATEYDVIPMLVGSTGYRGPIVVRDITPNHSTVFGTIVEPGHFSMADTQGQKNCKTKCEGYVCDVKNLWENDFKPKVDANEMALVDNYINWMRNRLKGITHEC